MKELTVGMRAARSAGRLIMKYYGKNFSVRRKGQIDLVTEVDEKSQKHIQSILSKSFPKDVVLGEEGKLSEAAQADRRWIVDPIDGTTNFAHAYPKFCVSIAFEKKQELQVGVIYDPVLDEVFYASRGKGAFLNGKRIQVSNETKLSNSLLVTGFPYNLRDPKTDNLPLFSKLLYAAQAIRRDGSAALNLAYVACGRFDGFWELGLKAWDVAAGIVIVEEAGGKILPLRNRRHQGLSTDMIAANPKLARTIKRKLAAN